MSVVRQLLSRAAAIASVMLLLAVSQPGFAQAPANETPQPELAPTISLAEARAIVGGAIAFARDNNFRLAVAVVDTAGNLVSADSMDGVRSNDMRGAEGKAFAAAIFRDTTQNLSDLVKTRPDRYFGIINTYGAKVYLVGGGVPLAVGGKLVGGVGVAGLHQFVDEKAARAGIAAWEKFRATMTK
jgi:glc operon protein GlcG